MLCRSRRQRTATSLLKFLSTRCLPVQYRLDVQRYASQRLSNDQTMSSSPPPSLASRNGHSAPAVLVYHPAYSPDADGGLSPISLLRRPDGQKQADGRCDAWKLYNDLEGERNGLGGCVVEQDGRL